MPLSEAQIRYRKSEKGRAVAAAGAKKYRQSPKGRANRSALQKRSHRRRRYGLNEREYDDLWWAQSGICAVCAHILTPGSRDVHVDHCHVTGRVRALLHSKCNVGLGHFNEASYLAAGAVAYLTRAEVMCNES